VRYTDYLEALRQVARGIELTEYASVEELGRPWSLMRIRTPGARHCLITAGFHGEEPAGPMSVLTHLEEVVDHARSRNVALTVYPCVNPSGFEAGHRYNAGGEHPNNDFIRYEKTPGVFSEEMAEGESFERWFLYDGGPRETRALRADIGMHPAPNAALDLHQDAWVGHPCHYAYFFGPPRPFIELMQRGADVVPVGANVVVHDHHETDEHGLLVHHDGSITDYLHRRGVLWTGVLETSTATPNELSWSINLLWMKAFVDFAAGDADEIALPAARQAN
jgi:predicted deacylase